MHENSPIAITGASGFVAKSLRKHLASFQLRSFSRKKLRPLKNEKVILADYSSYKKLGSCLKDCDVLVHLVGIGERRGQSTYADVNTNITSTIVRAARLAKIKQIIFLSGLGASSGNPSEYFASKFQAEQLIRSSGIDYTIFRPSFIIGQTDYLTKSLNRQTKNGRIIIPGTGRYVLQPISILDVVCIIEAAFLDKAFMGKTLDLVGPEAVPFEEYVRLFCKKGPVKTSKIPLEDCLRDALSNKKAIYSLEDLNIFYGGYVGDFAKLCKAYKNKIKHPRDFL